MHKNMRSLCKPAVFLPTLLCLLLYMRNINALSNNRFLDTKLNSPVNIYPNVEFSKIQKGNTY